MGTGPRAMGSPPAASQEVGRGSGPCALCKAPDKNKSTYKPRQMRIAALPLAAQPRGILDSAAHARKSNKPWLHSAKRRPPSLVVAPHPCRRRFDHQPLRSDLTVQLKQR